jgi:hypothetical protein
VFSSHIAYIGTIPCDFSVVILIIQFVLTVPVMLGLKAVGIVSLHHYQGQKIMEPYLLPPVTLDGLL